MTPVGRLPATSRGMRDRAGGGASQRDVQTRLGRVGPDADASVYVELSREGRGPRSDGADRNFIRKRSDPGLRGRLHDDRIIPDGYELKFFVVIKVRADLRSVASFGYANDRRGTRSGDFKFTRGRSRTDADGIAGRDVQRRHSTGRERQLIRSRTVDAGIRIADERIARRGRASDCLRNLRIRIFLNDLIRGRPDVDAKRADGQDRSAEQTRTRSDAG